MPWRTRYPRDGAKNGRFGRDGKQIFRRKFLNSSTSFWYSSAMFPQPGWFGEWMACRLALGLGLLLGSFDPYAALAASGVLFSEIHYHPVEEPAFNTNGTPVLDLSDDVHEFVELHNNGATAVDLTGWRLTG